MTRLRHALVLLVSVALCGLAVPAATSGAAAVSARARHCANGRPSHNYGDRARDAEHGIDITTLSVWNKDGDACYWTTVSGSFTKKKAQVIQAFYDTNRSHPGFEYQVFAYSGKDGDSRRGAYLLKKVKGGLVSVDCPVYSFFHTGQHQVGMGVPKTCLGAAGHVRVKVQLFDITTYRSGNRWRGQVDNAPTRGWTPLY